MTGREMFEALKQQAEEASAAEDGKDVTRVIGPAAKRDGVIYCEKEQIWKWCQAGPKGFTLPAGAAIISTSLSLFRDLFIYA